MTTTRPMTKSPRAVALEALRVGQQALPAYHSRFSRKDFTQPQLFAALALKAFLNTDYRGVAQLLDDWADLRTELGMGKAPHPATLCRAAQRLLKKGGSTPSWRPRGAGRTTSA
jgi:hypothetical protein